VRETLIFLWNYRREQFSEDSLRTALRKFLSRFEYAETAIIDLARWKDWTSLDQLIAAYGRPPWERPLAKEKVVAFMLACIKDLGGNKDSKSIATVTKARDFLETIDSKLVESVKKTAGGLGAVLDPVPEEILPKNDRE
jgi:hypothetical protein